VPILALLIALAAGVSWFWARQSRIHWAREVALPEAARLIEADKPAEAFDLLRDAGRRIPGDPRLQELLRACATTANLVTEPPDARVAWKRYNAPEAPWQPLAQAQLVPRAYLRFQISRDGYETQERAAFPSAPLAVNLYRVPAAAGMVYIPPGTFAMRPAAPPLKFGGYWLDRYEVTNREYKDFVDQGGYRERKYWTQEFVDAGKRLSWEEATARFRDATGRPGPATWELGAFPEGQDQYPVTGISWHEAAAYAQYAGKSLPTVYHWRRACPDGDFLVASLSNYGGKGAEKAGSRPGLTAWGNYDMAGNVKEWCWNNTGELRYLLGGAWNEPVYSFAEPDAQPAFARPANAGFRCAKYESPVPQPLLAEFRWVERDYAKEEPAGAEVYKAYSDLYAYDRSELAPVVEAVDEASKYWRREKVTFNAAYGNERVVALLFLPRGAKPPYQTVVYFPGAGDFLQRRKSDTIEPGQVEFVVRSGRALVYPVYRGTYERGGMYKTRLSPDSVAWRDLILSCYKDLGRSLDYLETRPDIDRSRIGYFGHSAGAVWGPLFLAVDGRFRAAVLEIGGLTFEKYRPEVDPLHFAPRVKTPVLMLNGRYDFAYPLHLCQEPLYRLLGTPAAGKKHVTFDSAHWVPRNGMIRETLDWLDRYLGPVDGH
jgi:formylglycine-generating enzyme required for sulfatase activity